MRRDEAVRILREHEAELRERGVVHMSLFGSVARDEANERSDVDVLAEFAPEIRLFAMGGVQVQLEEMFGCSVDLSVPAWLRPHVSESALREAVLVF